MPSAPSSPVYRCRRLTPVTRTHDDEEDDIKTSIAYHRAALDELIKIEAAGFKTVSDYKKHLIEQSIVARYTTGLQLKSDS